MKTFQFQVAGTKFRMTEYRIANPIRGDRLTLILEPINEHDPLAVKIMKGEHHIGYVPRTHNKDQMLQEALRDRPQEVGCCVDAAWASGCWVVVNIKEQNEEGEIPAGTIHG